MSEILNAHHLHKTWTSERFAGAVRAVRPWIDPDLQNAARPAPTITDVSFSVETGEIFGLVGPSGSGKSTLLGLLSGQLTPDSGHVELFGQDLAEVQVDRNRFFNHICLISQLTSSQVFNRMSPVENLLYSARLQRMTGPEMDAAALNNLARALLADLGVRPAEMDEPLSDMRWNPAHFSTLQKVVLGRALILLPRLLLMDEITDGLDLEMRQCVLEVLKTYCKVHGITMILATRSLRTAAQICDRITFLSKGKITHMIENDHQAFSVDLAPNQVMLVRNQSFVPEAVCELTV